MSTIAEIQQQCEYKMKRTIESLREDLSKLRTGRASVGILEHVMVDYYGSPTPLTQVANLGVADARTITVQPWDRKMVPVIEKAILTADLGLNPAAFGDLVRVPVPPLTEERRREICKVVRGDGEDAKVAVRNVRRDAMDKAKAMKKAGELTEDSQKTMEEDVQKLTDKYIKNIDAAVEEKQKEIMAV